MSPIETAEVPQAYRRLLVHEEHMTVAMEAHHESIVDVEVLQTRVTGDQYARKILLRRQSDQKVVQFGILRLNLSLLTDEVRSEIEQQIRPLGRILVRHNVMRSVHLDRLWRVILGKDLQQHFQTNVEHEAYGRTAAIDLGGRRAVEVLEIVAPET